MFTDLQHIQGRGRYGDTIVVARHSWHLGVNNLPRTCSSDYSEYSQTQSHMPCKLTAIHTPASRAMTIIHLWQHRNCKVQSMHWAHPGPGRTPYSLSPDSPVLGRRDSRCTWPTPPSGAPGQRQQHQWKSTCCSVPPLGKKEYLSQTQQETG